MKRLYLGSIYQAGVIQRFDIDDRTVEHSRIAKEQVEENERGMGWITTIDIPIPNSSITTLQDGRLMHDAEDDSESEYKIHVEPGFPGGVTASVGFYSEEGFINYFDCFNFDVAVSEDVYFGEYFLLAALRSDQGKLIIPSDREVFQAKLGNFMKTRAERENRNLQKERL